MFDAYSYEELLAMDSLQKFEPHSRLNFFSILIETARKRKDLQGIQKITSFIEQEQPEKLTFEWRLNFHFNAGNAYSYLLQIKHHDLPTEFEALNTFETEQQIIHLRKAYLMLDYAHNKLLKAQVCVNLGNIFSHVGRFVEAIEYWKTALQYMPNFGMASGNLGKSLLHYANQHYDEGQQYLMGKFAYNYLKHGARQKSTYTEAKDIFLQHAKDIEKYYGKERLKKIEQLDNFNNGRSNEEKDYRSWCLDNSLFVNPLNDVTSQNIANTDTLFLASLPADGFETPFAFTLFNQIKQEYVSARYLFFDGLHTNKTHFSDRGNMQMDTLDYAVYGFSTEKMKISYRMLYSLFDKIAFLLNQYFQLNKKEREISFRTIWYRDREKKQIFDQFTQTSNWPLRGLFWLSKDLLEDRTQLTGSILPDAKEIVKVRNFIEHKSFKIVMEGGTEMLDEGKTYSISFDDFYAKTMILFKLSRAALIYLSLAIYQAEEERPQKGVIMPMYMPQIDHKFKK